MPLEQPHHTRPAQRRKHRPAILPRRLSPLGPPVHDPPPAMMRRVDALGDGDARLHGQLGDGQTHAREDVDDDLLGDAAVDAAAEDGVAAEQAGEERVGRVDLAGVELQQRQHRGLVEEGEVGEVAGVLPRGFEDEPELLAQRPVAEEEDHSACAFVLA